MEKLLGFRNIQEKLENSIFYVKNEKIQTLTQLWYAQWRIIVSCWAVVVKNEYDFEAASKIYTWIFIKEIENQALNCSLCVQKVGW